MNVHKQTNKGKENEVSNNRECANISNSRLHLAVLSMFKEKKSPTVLNLTSSECNHVCLLFTADVQKTADL